MIPALAARSFVRLFLTCRTMVSIPRKLLCSVSRCERIDMRPVARLSHPPNRIIAANRTDATLTSTRTVNSENVARRHPRARKRLLMPPAIRLRPPNRRNANSATTIAPIAYALIITGSTPIASIIAKEERTHGIYRSSRTGYSFSCAQIDLPRRGPYGRTKRKRKSTIRARK
jgi:hypothetical protein